MLDYFSCIIKQVRYVQFWLGPLRVGAASVWISKPPCPPSDWQMGCEGLIQGLALLVTNGWPVQVCVITQDMSDTGSGTKLLFVHAGYRW